jgi:hypothetical protein
MGLIGFLSISLNCLFKNVARAYDHFAILILAWHLSVPDYRVRLLPAVSEILNVTPFEISIDFISTWAVLFSLDSGTSEEWRRLTKTRKRSAMMTSSAITVRRPRRMTRQSVCHWSRERRVLALRGVSQMRTCWRSIFPQVIL